MDMEIDTHTEQPNDDEQTTEPVSHKTDSVAKSSNKSFTQMTNEELQIEIKNGNLQTATKTGVRSHACLILKQRQLLKEKLFVLIMR